jgi:NAD(P)-dependent dehydrogenase (short-subunit alcohol dehydrogenase family)
MNRSTVLITGGFGFLGRAIARKFKELDYRVIGIGRGHWAPEEWLNRGFDVWLNAGVTLSSLMTMKERFDLIAPAMVPLDIQSPTRCRTLARRSKARPTCWNTCV